MHHKFVDLDVAANLSERLRKADDLSDLLQRNGFEIVRRMNTAGPRGPYQVLALGHVQSQAGVRQPLQLEASEANTVD